MIAVAGRTLPGRRRAGGLRRFWDRHPERGLAAVALAAWAVLTVTTASGGHLHPASELSWGRLLAGWLLMVPAMMIPPSLPMARHVARSSLRSRRRRSVFVFAGASLLPWLAAGAFAVAPAALLAPTVSRRWLLGGALLAAAAWELTPAKRRALKGCHRTIPLPPQGRRADRACVELGLLYGRSCFRACWALMLPMALVGHPGLTLMLVLTSIATVQETVRKGYRLAPPAAVLLTAAGMMVLVLG